MRRHVRLLAVVAVVLVAAGAVGVRLIGDDEGPADRAVFDEALARLAMAPALTYSTTGFGGAVEVDYRVTATGQSLASIPPVEGLPGSLTMDLMLVDNKLFFRFDGELSPEDLGLDPDNPLVQDALGEAQQAMLSGRWTTSVSEYDGPMVRNEMTPVGLALKLADMLAETPDDRLATGASVGDHDAYVAHTPGGDVYVSAGEPHQVLRFVPANARDRGDRPRPTLPSVPELPDVPAPPSRPGGGSDSGGSDSGGSDAPNESGPPTLPPDLTLPPDMSVPPGMSVPELPSVPTTRGLHGGRGRSAAAQPPPSEQPPSEPSEQPPSEQPPSEPSEQPPSEQPPSEPSEQPPSEQPPSEQEIPPLIEGGVDQVDIRIMAPEEAGEVYADLRTAAEELNDAVDNVLRFAEDELTESLEREIAAGRAFPSCGPESCRVAAPATLVHGRGNEVPTELTFALTVDGRPAGECRATGVIPVSGTGRLGCTNDSDEWRAAYRPGGRIDASVVDINALAVTPDDVQRIVRDIDRHAAEVLEGRPAVRQGVRGAGGGSSAPRRLAPPETPPATVTDAAGDPALRAILDELGVSASDWDRLLARAGRPAPTNRTSTNRRLITAETIRPSDLAALRSVLLELARPEMGTRPLDHIDRDSLQRVVSRALSAPTRTSLLHALGTLQTALDVIRRSQLAPGRADSLREGTQIFLDVTQDEVSTGGRTIDLRSLTLEATADRQLDVLYLGRGNVWQAVAVFHDPATARRQSGLTLQAIELMARMNELGGQGTTWYRHDTAIDQLLEPLQGNEYADRDSLPSEPPPSPVVRMPDVLPPADVPAFERQSQATVAAAYVDGTRVGDVHQSGAGDHAEEALRNSGDLAQAVDQARNRAAQDQPARLDVAINRAPCSSEHECSTLLQDTAGEVEGIEGADMRVLITGNYNPNPPRANDTSSAEGTAPESTQATEPESTQTTEPESTQASEPESTQTGGTEPTEATESEASGSETTPSEAARTSFITEMRNRGVTVAVPIPNGGLRPGGAEYAEALRNETATRNRGHSLARITAANGVNSVIGRTDLVPEQQHALANAHEEKRQSTGNRVPRADRPRYSSFDSTRQHLAPQLRRQGVALDPLGCTCPGCGQTRQPALGPG